MSIFFLVCEAIGTAATLGLLCQPRVIVKMIVEKQVECTLAGETEVLGENLPQRHFCPSQNPTWPDSGLNPGRRDGKSATNRLSYGAAFERKRFWPGKSMVQISDQTRIILTEFLFGISQLFLVNAGIVFTLVHCRFLLPLYAVHFTV
jgi:hypothetical protein